MKSDESRGLVQYCVYSLLAIAQLNVALRNEILIKDIKGYLLKRMRFGSFR